VGLVERVKGGIVGQKGWIDLPTATKATMVEGAFPSILVWVIQIHQHF